MRRIRVLGLVGLAIVACSRRPLSDDRMKLPRDGAATTDAATTDVATTDAPTIDVTDVADVRADLRSDSASPGPDAGTKDGAGDGDPPRDAVPTDDAADAGAAAADAVADAGAADTTAVDAGPPPDGGCVGNGRPAQTGPLFAPPVRIPIPGPPQLSGFNAESIGVGDVTGDGRADIVVGSHHPALVVYPQMPDGSLGAPVSYPIAPLPSGSLDGPSLLDIGDLNGDGRMDVVFNRNDGIGFMPGNAAGGLGPEERWPQPAQAISGSHLAIADLDGDGRSDLVVMPYLSNGVEVRLQNAAGALVTAGSNFRCQRDAYTALAIGDANGDGRPDIALSNNGGEICLMVQRPTGDLGNVLSLQVGGQIPAVGIGAFGTTGGCGPAIAFTVAGNRPNSRLGLMSWVQGMPASATYQNAYDIPDQMAVADVDGDGRQDVVVLHIVWLQVGVFRAAPGGGLAAEELYPFPSINHGPDRLAIGDVNGDGRPDIVSADFDLAILYHR